ncbi:energy transducer TonB [Microvirga sp. BT689]|uniref:energy transducer TonB n=1 Tax=Microvirga arvi TaxID=2778731 RepID=UPI0019506FEC|nr:TonB family protein [Microvirga arvi]MBM6581963.1 energy transducer TonB [Microvirga arvi]
MSVQSIGPAQELSRLGIAFMTALALHGAVLGALTLWHSDEAVNPPGEQEITIDLAPAMEETVSVVPAEMSAVEAPLEEPEVPPQEPDAAKPLPPEEVMEAHSEPGDMTEAAPVEAEIESEPEPVVALPPPETVVAKPLEEKPAPKPERKPSPKSVGRRTPLRQTAAEQKARPSDPRRGQASSSPENAGGASASADPNVLNRYVASLAAALRSRLRYPDAARSQEITGVAVLRFTMDRSGRIVSSTLMRSAGHPSLDQAALTTASPGSSLPPAPSAIPQQQFTISVPLRFNLR